MKEPTRAAFCEYVILKYCTSSTIMFNNEVNMRRITPHKNKYIFLMCLMCEGGRPRF